MSMPRGLRLVLVAFGISVSTISSLASTYTARVSQGATVQVQVERDTAMKVGSAVRAKIIYPIYIDNQLVLPAGSELLGKVSALTPAPKKVRLNAHLSGDFTPLHDAQVEFDELVLPGGTHVQVHTHTIGGGTQIVRFLATTSGHHPSVWRKLWATAVGREKETVRTFTAPGKMERAKRTLYYGLPYHPELLLSGTEYSVQFPESVGLPISLDPSNTIAPEKGVQATVKVAAALMDDINSKETVPGAKVRAVVTEPLFNSEHEVQVPQGSVLLGVVTQSQPAGKWGRGGTLRFSFRELQFPAGFTQRVHGATAAVDADQKANLEVDAEGGIKPARKSAVLPLVTGLLAAAALHDDEASVVNTAVASNGFKIIGRVLALSLKSQYVGAAIGFYGTGRLVYSRFIGHGTDVKFPKNTRIEVVLDPVRVNALHPPETRQ